MATARLAMYSRLDFNMVKTAAAITTSRSSSTSTSTTSAVDDECCSCNSSRTLCAPATAILSCQKPGPHAEEAVVDTTQTPLEVKYKTVCWRSREKKLKLCQIDLKCLLFELPAIVTSVLLLFLLTFIGSWIRFKRSVLPCVNHTSNCFVVVVLLLLRREIQIQLVIFK